MDPPPDAGCCQCGTGRLVRRRCARWPSFNRWAFPVGVLGTIAAFTYLGVLSAIEGARVRESYHHGGVGFAAAGSVLILLAVFAFVVLLPVVLLLYWWLGRRAVLVCETCGARDADRA